MPISWADFAAKPRVATPFLVDPYVPREGIVLLYAKTSRGKSPFTWELARCVGTGDSFLGRPTTSGRVLYLEVDTPEMLIHERIMDAGLTPAANVWWEFHNPFDVLKDARAVHTLKLSNAEVRPDLVVINTLRKVYGGDDISSEMPKQVYGAFKGIFPASALLFVHHERKTRGGMDNANVEEREDHAGSAAWLNDCTVGIQIVKDPAPKGGDPNLDYLRLQHGKSQVSALHKPIHLTLRGGAHWTVVNDEEKVSFVSIWQSTEGGSEERKRAVGLALGLGRTAVTARAKGYGLLGDRPGRIGRDLVTSEEAA